MYLPKSKNQENFVKKIFFVGILKATDKKSRIWIRDPDPCYDVTDPQHWTKD